MVEYLFHDLRRIYGMLTKQVLITIFAREAKIVTLFSLGSWWSTQCLIYLLVFCASWKNVTWCFRQQTVIYLNSDLSQNLCSVYSRLDVFTDQFIKRMIFIWHEFRIPFKSHKPRLPDPLKTRKMVSLTFSRRLVFLFHTLNGLMDRTEFPLLREKVL